MTLFEIMNELKTLSPNIWLTYDSFASETWRCAARTNGTQRNVEASGYDALDAAGKCLEKYKEYKKQGKIR